jgi:hypothetical protein
MGENSLNLVTLIAFKGFVYKNEPSAREIREGWSESKSLEISQKSFK